MPLTDDDWDIIGNSDTGIRMLHVDLKAKPTEHSQDKARVKHAMLQHVGNFYMSPS